MILYSIIIAVYNVERYLEECLESIIAQSYTNWEAILVDDGSSDKGSARICDIYARKDTRFKVFHRENEGSLMARRFGLQHSMGDYVLFVDSDDYIHKNLLYEVNKIIKNNQSDLVVYRFQWINELTSTDSEIIFPEGTILRGDTLSRQRLWRRVVTCNSLNNLWLKVVKRDCIDIEEDYTRFAYLKSGTDLIQSLPILDNAKQIYFTEKILYFYRYNDSGISAQKEKRIKLKEIDGYFKDKKVLMEQRLYFLKKNNVTKEVLNLHFASYFKSSMEILISWLANESDRKKRALIVRRVLQERGLSDCKGYIEANELLGYNRILFQLYNEHDLKKFFIMLDILVVRRNVILAKGRIINYVIRRRNVERK